MTSTQCTVEKTNFHEEKYIGRSLRDCETVGGTKPNIQYGKKTKVKDKKLTMTSKISHKKLKKYSSVGEEGCLHDLSTKSSVNKRSFDECEAMHVFRDFKLGFEEYRNWDLEVEKRYDEESADSIIGMLSYMENIYNGFGSRNDEELYKDERVADYDGTLYKEACRGFEYYKKYNDSRDMVKHKKIKYVTVKGDVKLLSL